MKTKIEISGKQDATSHELTDPRISIKELAELKAVSPVRISKGNRGGIGDSIESANSSRNKILADNELENNGAGLETLPLIKRRQIMSPKQEVISLAKFVGAKIITDRTPNQFDIEVEAPYGFHWSEGDVHVLVANIYYTEDISTTEVWQDLFERMQSGLCPCSYDCEFWI